MNTVVGIFTDSEAARRAAKDLETLGVRSDHITVLFPGEVRRLHTDVPTVEAERPGVGTALGGVVGGATGASAGVQAGALIGMFVPGVGPVFALGALGAVLLGVAGAAAGAALESGLPGGVPKDELFVYEELLRQGRALVIALTSDEAQADQVRRHLAEAGAESLDAAKERWWVGLRDVEAKAYSEEGGDFVRDEADYRLGFEAALGLGHGAYYSDVVGELQKRYPQAYAREPFRRGYERGRRHAETRHSSRRVA
jgi:hypothetical protein